MRDIRLKNSKEIIMPVRMQMNQTDVKTSIKQKDSKKPKREKKPRKDKN